MINKFRAWDKAENSIYDNPRNSRMSYFGAERFISDEGYLQFFSPNGKNPLGDHEQERFELMQSTGLKDKNGKEIFEGDIVKYDYGNPLKREIPNPQIREVALIDGSFCLKNDEPYYSQPINTNLSFRNKDCEIIGDIYSNPELKK